ncbi:MAG: helix-turn-helix domain-containing protein [Bacilli bacterium]|nr:helix-turn-helix domain-containing protein [Bacilli bacterium]
MKRNKLIKLEYYRKQNNLSQAKLAKLIGVERYRISDWEQGRSEPSIENLEKLSATLCVPISNLINQDFIKIFESSDPGILKLIEK